MTDAQTSPSAAELFQIWKQVIDGGTLATESVLALVADEHQERAAEVRQLIEAYFGANRTDAESTATGGLPGRAAAPAPEIPGYTVEAYLGGGGMGEVWRVRDRLDRPFALKLVRPDRFSTAARERFMAEAGAMARLNHSHVAPIHHFDIFGDLPYFLMRSYPGSLKDRLADYQADPRSAIRLMAQVADGVGHLHEKGFVHRDLKPGNVLLDQDGTPAVSDFGLVKAVSEESVAGDPGSVAGGSSETFPSGPRRSKTLAGAVLGTRAYMSPEQAAGRSERANPRWDVWSLGVMLHELLTGRLPPSSAAPDRLLNPAVADNPPPSQLKPGLDRRCEQVIRKCLARDELDRYPDAAAVAKALRALTRRPSRRVIAGLVAGALLVIGLVAVLVLTPPPDPEPVSGPGLPPVRGEPVVLVPDVGPPAWHRVALGAANAVETDAAARERVLTLDSNRSLVVDLSSDPGVDEYRLEAEVQSAGVANSQLGLFVGRELIPTPVGGFQTFVGLSFAEGGIPGPGGVPVGRWELTIRSILEDEAGRRIHRNQEVASGTYPMPEHPESVWHRLAVDVSPDHQTWYFDGGAVGTVAAAPGPVEQRMFQNRLGVGPECVLRFSPRSPVGVFNLSGLGQFRTVRLTPVRRE